MYANKRNTRVYPGNKIIMKKRIMVDMSATLIHHGHIRLLKRASELGSVIVGLTTDQEIIDKKKYKPELSFKYREEILRSIKYVSDVVPTPWLIDKNILNEHEIDILIHGDDNSNQINKENLVLTPRTKGISSSDLRFYAQRAITEKNNQKLMLTPGPATVLHENIQHIKPLFGRGDDEYTKMAEHVLEWVKSLCGQDQVYTAQGSSTFALELALHSFVKGSVLLVSTGYYSDRLEQLLPEGCKLTKVKYDDIDHIKRNYDWVLCAYTETSVAFKVDIEKIKDLSDRCDALLYLDATGSIGLEEKHDLADLMAFSSCKGLFGLTGACFLAHKKKLTPRDSSHFYFNINTHKEKMVTGPYHAIASLYGVISNHSLFRDRVIKSKNKVLKNWKNFVRQGNQPLLCTYLEGKVIPKDSDIVLYNPRSNLDGSVICHFGEIHSDRIRITERISIK